ncbi:Hypothetical predicted protein [Paramuricea clavata]|uniref:Uncharacterized protein n=1 Tax=Paramuricea clavata TaxID=317549 RepID=A0A6S7HTK0_PARCT|nr:Hypothetical predicted protein [Paramuricea clavata]
MENEAPEVVQGEIPQVQPAQLAMLHQILPPQPLDLRNSGEIGENWKLWKEKYSNYFVISRLQQESEQYQLAMFKHAIGDDGLKSPKISIKSTSRKQRLSREFPKERKGYNLARKFHVNFVATNTRKTKRNARNGEKLVIDAKKETILLRNARKPQFTLYSIESEDEYEEISMVKVQEVREKAVFAKIHINNKAIKFQIDCGASVNVLPLMFAKDVELTPCTNTLVMWNGTKVKPLGSCILPVINPKKDVKYQVKFLVVEENWTPLLGLNAVEKMKLLTVHSENFVNVVEKCDNDPVNKYPDVFDENLGTLPGKVHLQVDATCKPVVLPARKIPVTVKEKFKNELKRLEDLKVRS